MSSVKQKQKEGRRQKDFHLPPLPLTLVIIKVRSLKNNLDDWRETTVVLVRARLFEKGSLRQLRGRLFIFAYNYKHKSLLSRICMLSSRKLKS